MSRMNPEIKARWAAALRSGKYKQGRGYLNRNGQFCCLGVLCDLAIKDGICDAWITSPAGAYSFISEEGDDCVALVPPSVIKWAGIVKKTGPAVSIGGSAKQSVVEFNDGGRATFAEIADAIEEQL